MFQWHELHGKPERAWSEGESGPTNSGLYASQLLRPTPRARDCFHWHFIFYVHTWQIACTGGGEGLGGQVWHLEMGVSNTLGPDIYLGETMPTESPCPTLHERKWWSKAIMLIYLARWPVSDAINDESRCVLITVRTKLAAVQTMQT